MGWVDRHRRKVAVASMAVSMACWIGLEPVFARLSAYSPFQVVWTRYAFHVALMLAVFGPFRGRGLLRTTLPATQIARGAMMLGVVVCYTLAVQGMRPGDVRAVFLAAALLVLPLAYGLLRERPSAAAIAAVVVASAGGWLIFRPGPAVADSPAIALALAMAVCFALYVVGTRRLAQQDVFTNVFYSGAVVCVGLTPTVPGVWRTPRVEDLGWMIVIGIVGIVILTSLEWAIHLWRASRLAPFLLLRPAFAVGFGLSRPTDLALVGVALVLAACGTATWGAWRQDREAAGAPLSKGAAGRADAPTVVPPTS